MCLQFAAECSCSICLCVISSWGRVDFLFHGLAHRLQGHAATFACVSAAWEVHQPTSDELQRHSNEEGGAAHGTWRLHWVSASKAGERREENNYRYSLGNQLVKIQNEVQLESWFWHYSVVGCVQQQLQMSHSKPLSIPDFQFLEIRPPKKVSWCDGSHMPCRCAYAGEPVGWAGLVSSLAPVWSIFNFLIVSWYLNRDSDSE